MWRRHLVSNAVDPHTPSTECSHSANLTSLTRQVLQMQRLSWPKQRKSFLGILSCSVIMHADTNLSHGRTLCALILSPTPLAIQGGKPKDTMQICPAGISPSVHRKLHYGETNVSSAVAYQPQQRSIIWKLILLFGPPPILDEPLQTGFGLQNVVLMVEG